MVSFPFCGTSVLTCKQYFSSLTSNINVNQNETDQSDIWTFDVVEGTNVVYMPGDEDAWHVKQGSMVLLINDNFTLVESARDSNRPDFCWQNTGLLSPALFKGAPMRFSLTVLTEDYQKYLFADTYQYFPLPGLYKVQITVDASLTSTFRVSVTNG
jgi:hypothetical protein